MRDAKYVELMTKGIPNLARRLSLMMDSPVTHEGADRFRERREQVMRELHEALGAVLVEPEPTGSAFVIAFEDTDDFAPYAVVKGSEEDIERISRAMAKEHHHPEHLITAYELPFYDFEES